MSPRRRRDVHGVVGYAAVDLPARRRYERRPADDGAVQARNEVTSDVAFTFDSPTQHLKGIGFTADPDFRNVATKQLTGTGGQLVLPHQ